MRILGQQSTAAFATMSKNISKRLFGMSMLACGLLIAASSAQANDLYISQSGAGAGNGAGCGDSFPASWFNSGSNWGSSATQIGPGTIVHLCGTITGNAGSTGLTFQGSGVSGRPIVLLFESGARLSSPQWGAAIASNNKSFITIDGGSNGVVESTMAGSSGAPCTGGTCSIHDPSSDGISITGGSNIEVKNLTVQNIYIHRGTSGDGGNAKAINFHASLSSQSNILVHDNIVHDAHAAIFFGFNTLSNVQVYNNTTYNHVWGVAFLDNNTGSNATGIQVYGNDISGFVNWAGPSGGDNGFHMDGVFFAATNSSTSFTNSSIYNNYLHGAMTNPATGHIYLTGSGGGMRGNKIYNNLFVASPNAIGHSGPDEEGLIVLGFGSQATSVYNNTFVSQTPGIDIRDAGTTVAAIKNNIFSGDSSGPMFTAILNKTRTNLNGLVSNNDYYNLASLHMFEAGDGTSVYGSLSAWQSACGCDSDSIVGNPNFDSGYHLQSGSAAINLGAPLNVLSILSLNLDKADNPRPSSGSWDSGAYQSGTSANNTLAAPSGLKAEVQ
jgi:hypothetical protein